MNLIALAKILFGLRSGTLTRALRVLWAAWAPRLTKIATGALLLTQSQSVSEVVFE